MSDINDILLEGEQVLWSGAPDWSAAGRKNRPGDKSGILWGLAIIAAALVVVFVIGVNTPAFAFYRIILQGAGIVLVVIGLFMALAFFAGGPSPDKKVERYFITTKRLLVVDMTDHIRVSIFPGAVTYLTLQKCGGAQNIFVGVGDNEDDVRALYALTDGETAEKLLLERFAREKATS